MRGGWRSWKKICVSHRPWRRADVAVWRDGGSPGIFWRVKDRLILSTYSKASTVSSAVGWPRRCAMERQHFHPEPRQGAIMDITKITAISAIVFGLAGMAAPLTYAQDMQGTVAYMNGGIGAGEQAKLREAAKDYNLRLLFSEAKDGAYVSNVKLDVTDHHDKSVFHLPSAGPMTNLKLPAGQYQVTAIYNGVKKTSKVSVGEKPVSLSFNWVHQDN
jgi:hypothetical protein